MKPEAKYARLVRYLRSIIPPRIATEKLPPRAGINIYEGWILSADAILVPADFR